MRVIGFCCSGMICIDIKWSSPTLNIAPWYNFLCVSCTIASSSLESISSLLWGISSLSLRFSSPNLVGDWLSSLVSCLSLEFKSTSSTLLVSLSMVGSSSLKSSSLPLKSSLGVKSSSVPSKSSLGGKPSSPLLFPSSSPNHHLPH